MYGMLVQCVPDCDFCKNLHVLQKKIFVVHNSGKSIQLKPCYAVNFDASFILEVHIPFLLFKTRKQFLMPCKE